MHTDTRLNTADRNVKSGYLYIKKRNVSFALQPCQQTISLGFLIEHGNCKQKITVLYVEGKNLFTEKLPRLKPKIRCIFLVLKTFQEIEDFIT